MAKVLPAPSLDYFAAFFDGEGCISTAHSKQSHPAPKAKVGQVVGNDEILQHFQKRWGGRMLPVRPPAANRRALAVWTITGQAMLRFLLDLLPSLRQKRMQAQIALMMQAMIRPAHAGEAWLRQRLAVALSNLNRGRTWS